MSGLTVLPGPEPGPSLTGTALGIEETEAVVASESMPLLHNRQVTAPAGRSYVVAALLGFTCSLCMATTLIQVPNLQIYRFVLCQSYYAGTGDLDLIRLIGKYDGSLDERCSIDAISKQVATINGLAGFFENFGAILVVLPYGRLADVYGRKIPGYIFSCGFLLALLSTFLVVARAGAWHPYTLLLPPILVGLSGAGPVVRAMLHAVICDSFDGPPRLVAISWLSAIFGICNAVSPALGSWLLDRGLLWPLWTAIGFATLSSAILLCMPETHPGLKHELIPTLEPTQLTNDENLYAVFTQPTSFLGSATKAIKSSFGALSMLGRDSNFMLMAIVSLASASTSLIFMLIIQYLHNQLGWSVSATGYYLSVNNFTKLLVLVFGLPLFTRFLEGRLSSPRMNQLLIQTGMACNTLATIGFAFLSSSTMLPLLLLLLSFGAPTSSAIAVLNSTLVSANEVGTLFAAFAVVEGVGEMLGSLATSAVYSATLEKFPGAVFLFTAAIYGTGLLAASCVKTSRLTVLREQDDE